MSACAEAMITSATPVTITWRALTVMSPGRRKEASNEGERARLNVRAGTLRRNDPVRRDYRPLALARMLQTNRDTGGPISKGRHHDSQRCGSVDRVVRAGLLPFPPGPGVHHPLVLPRATQTAVRCFLAHRVRRGRPDFDQRHRREPGCVIHVGARWDGQ